MQMTFELYAFNEMMKRQQLRRRYPDASDSEIEEYVVEWLYRRTGVEHGDGDGATFVVREHEK